MYVQSYVSYSDATTQSALHCFQSLIIVSSYHVSSNDILLDIHFFNKAVVEFRMKISVASLERKIIACDNMNVYLSSQSFTQKNTFSLIHERNAKCSRVCVHPQSLLIILSIVVI